jgi:perosamine synthetase
MLVTDRDDLHRRVLFLRDHGRTPGDRMFHNTEVGWKYKMSSMQAALGLAQLERIDELVERKRQIFGWYRDRLGGLPGVTLNHEAPGVKNTYWMVSVIVDPGYGVEKDQLQRIMGDAGVDTRPFFRPLSSLPAYAHLPQAAEARERNVVSYRLSPWGLNLPSGLNLDEGMVDRVCQALARALGTHAPAAA